MSLIQRHRLSLQHGIVRSSSQWRMHAGPMLQGATQVLFEGVPTWPDAGRIWQIVDRYHVSQLYTAPTAIRSLISKGDDFVTRHSRKSLRILGSVGEPINPEAWKWYHEVSCILSASHLSGRDDACGSYYNLIREDVSFGAWLQQCKEASSQNKQA